MAYHAIYPALGGIDRTTGVVTTVDLSANQSGGVLNPTGEMFNFSYQFYVVSGTPTGTFYVEVSNDPRLFDPTYATSARWEPAQSVVFTTGTAPNGSAGCAVLVQNGWRFSRCRWLFSASTGTGWCMANGVSI